MVCYGDERLERELLECEEVLARFDPSFSSGSKLFRPPCGLLSKRMKKTLVRLGYTIVMTNCWSLDANIPNNATWHAKTMLRGLEPDCIVCLHCPTKPGRNSRIQTLEITRLLLEEGRRRGIQFC